MVSVGGWAPSAWGPQSSWKHPCRLAAERTVPVSTTGLNCWLFESLILTLVEK